MKPTTIPLLPHERLAAERGELRAIWRPVEPQPVRHDTPTGLMYEIPNAVGLFAEHVVSGCLPHFLACPFGQPGDVVVGQRTVPHAWDEDTDGESDVTLVTHERQFRIASVAVRRVSEMTEGDAVAWGLAGLNAVRDALYVWYWHYGAAEWAWYLKLEAPK